MPRMPLSGVRISWLMTVRKRVLASEAAAARQASAVRSSTSWFIICIACSTVQSRLRIWSSIDWKAATVRPISSLPGSGSRACSMRPSAIAVAAAESSSSGWLMRCASGRASRRSSSPDSSAASTIAPLWASRLPSRSCWSICTVTLPTRSRRWSTTGTLRTSRPLSSWPSRLHSPGVGALPQEASGVVCPAA